MKLFNVLFLSIALIAVSCVGKNEPSTLSEIRGEVLKVAGQGANPFVEAYIEYTGPQKRWAGPATFILHVVARDKGEAKIWVTPPLFTEEFIQKTPARKLASANEDAKGMKVEVAREQLAILGNEIQKGKDANFKGCLSPVRVWLIDDTGAITEKKGCRGKSDWTLKTSQIVDQFLSASLYGVMPANGSK